MRIWSILMGLLWYIENRLLQQCHRLLRLIIGPYRDATVDDLKVIHKSPHWIVLDKRYDLLINNTDKTLVTVERQLERQFPDLVNPKLQFSFFFPHRLDYSTSGILVIPTNKRACAEACEVFRSRRVKKYYLAIVRGHISSDFMSIDEPIGSDIRPVYANTRMQLSTSPHCCPKPRSASTHLAVLQRGVCHAYPATKVLLHPITGRRHQLRLHCNHIGHTIVGDFTYSNRRDFLPYRMYLHALRLVLPNSLESLDISTKDPFDPDDPRNEWIPQEVVRTTTEAYAKFEAMEGDPHALAYDEEVAKRAKIKPKSYYRDFKRSRPKLKAAQTNSVEN